ncbi:MAG TPA: pyrroline-5-carboxylate reductase dimerization domain-containing protein [Sphingomicrobium sp.]|jgi:pyrroline-5-carboxylate reductase
MSDLLKLPEPTWFVGCGNMGQAIIDGWRLGGLDVSGVTVIRPSGRPVEGTNTISRLPDSASPPRLVVLGFKPQQLDAVAPELNDFLLDNSVVVSLLAGVEVASLRARLPNAGSIVRALPNLPVAIRRGVIGLYTADAPDDARQDVGNMFAALGFAMWMADEAKLAALGSVAGAGPAYVARFIAALTKAGVQRGLTHDIAAAIARETVLGTAWLGATTREDMGALAQRVASPKGTTEAGLAVLDRDGALDRLVGETIEAASRRGAVLASEARVPSLEEGSLEEGGRLH